MNRFMNQLLVSEKIFTEFEFNSGATTITTIREVLKLKGVCQDLPMIACVRSLGLPLAM
jgi:hypothetical protein